MEKPRSTFGKAMDAIGGVSRYDSTDHVDSAPEMARRKAASQGAPKGPFSQTKGGKQVKLPAPKEKAPLKRSARY